MEVVHCPFQPRSLLLWLLLRTRIHLKLVGPRRWCRWRVDRWRTWRNLVRLRILFFPQPVFNNRNRRHFVESRSLAFLVVRRIFPLLAMSLRRPLRPRLRMLRRPPRVSRAKRTTSKANLIFIHRPHRKNRVYPFDNWTNTSSDLMPRWAQDCFYRTVVLGLKPLLLQDIPSSPNKPPKRSSSTCSIESTDSLGNSQWITGMYIERQSKQGHTCSTKYLDSWLSTSERTIVVRTDSQWLSRRRRGRGRRRGSSIAIHQPLGRWSSQASEWTGSSLRDDLSKFRYTWFDLETIHRANLHGSSSTH